MGALSMFSLTMLLAMLYGSMWPALKHEYLLDALAQIFMQAFMAPRGCALITW